MLAAPSHPVAPPVQPEETVVDQVFRFPEGAPPREVALIRPRGDGGAAPGPAGFSAMVRRLAPGEEGRVGAPRGAWASVHLVEGALDVDPRARGDWERLAPLDAAAVRPEEPGRLRNPGTREAVFVELAYHAPEGRRLALPSLRRPRSVVRLAASRPLRTRVPLRFVPDRAYDLLSPRDLYPVLGPVAHGPGRFELLGPDGLVVVHAQTPRGTGPSLHVHTLTTEMFVVLRGRFRITWGDRGEHATELGALSAIVVPQGVSRAFEAVTDDAWIMPIVVGANDETEDIVWLEDVARELRDSLPAPLAALASRTRLRFGHRA